MAGPAFAVQYLVFCESVEYPDPARPHRDSILHRVDYVLSAPPGTEFPFEPVEFWLFARFYWLRDRPGRTPPLTMSCVWRDRPGGAAVIWRRRLGRVRFVRPNDVTDRGWTFRNFADDVRYPFPGPGRYEFRLWYRGRPSGVRVKAREHIRVEVRP